MITFEALNDEVRRLADEEPDKHAECSLLSSRDGVTPVCIYGQAFHNLGVKLSMKSGEMESDLFLNGEAVGHSTEGISEMNFTKLGITHPSPQQIQWASLVQDGQDNGREWGRAVAIADHEMGLVPA